ncbi:ETX/MTX2 family pore-forming toxin [Streptomyces sp. NPDC001404]|uniref:ETX/MTX2 family pore-forming toxin n=1 Tax=Streptomyces sp. NPDC001404 TaxID=3364571 RepID=UPI0036AF27B9
MSQISRRKALGLAAAAGAAASATALGATPVSAAPRKSPDSAPTPKSAAPKAGSTPRSLQEITDAWGNWVARTQFPHSGGYWFTESTAYGRQGALDPYHQYQVNQKYSGIVYDASAPSPEPGEVTSVVTNYRNGTELEQTVEYRQAMLTRRNLKLSVTESLQIGVTSSASVTIPGVADIGQTTTIQTDLSSTKEFGMDKEQEWSVTLPLRIPPKSHVEATLVVGTQEYDIDWTAMVTLTGRAAIWFNNKVDFNHNGDLHYLWFPSIERVLSDTRKNNLIDTTGYEVVGSSVQARARGVFYGGQGVAVSVNTKQYPLDGRGAVLERRIPLGPDGKPDSLSAR